MTATEVFPTTDYTDCTDLFFLHELSRITINYHELQFMDNLWKIRGNYMLNKKQATMNKTFEQECAEGRFAFDPSRSFEQRCEIVRRTAITRDMTYEERLAAQRRRYGL